MARWQGRADLVCDDGKRSRAAAITKLMRIPSEHETKFSSMRTGDGQIRPDSPCKIGKIGVYRRI